MEFSDAELLDYYHTWEETHSEALDQLEPGSNETVSICLHEPTIPCHSFAFIAFVLYLIYVYTCICDMHGLSLKASFLIIIVKISCKQYIKYFL